MKRVVTTWALLVLLFGFVGIVEAVQPARHFVAVSTTPSKLELGTSPHPGMYESPETLTVDVEANCIHGPIVISATRLKRIGGGIIPPERIAVKTAATGGFVTMSKPVAISKPEKGSHKIVLNFRVETGFEDPAGKYAGTIMFTVMPPS